MRINFRYNFIAISVVPFSIVMLISCGNSNSEKRETSIVSLDSIELELPSPVEIEEFNAQLLELESDYIEILSPISSLKTTESTVYWFIVSWLNTAYRTPNWKGYYSEEWMIRSKKEGIDCSGFARIMLDQVFNKKVKGGSQGILNRYCIPIGMSSLEMGDLVFFRAPYSTNDRIVHVGVYLQDDYFVHATSTKSAAIGLGLSVNSLQEENWKMEFVTGGKIKE